MFDLGKYIFYNFFILTQNWKIFPRERCTLISKSFGATNFRTRACPKHLFFLPCSKVYNAETFMNICFFPITIYKSKLPCKHAKEVLLVHKIP